MTALVRRAALGAVAGAVGTLAMDLVWYARKQREDGEEAFTDWEFSASTSSFDDASAPGKVGKKVADRVGVEIPDEVAGETSNLVHWLTGVGYGVGHALLNGHRGVLPGGALTGVGAFANSYVTLGAIGVYEPIWEYDRRTLWKDLSAHLAYGLATSATYRFLRSVADPEPDPLLSR